MNLIEVLVGLAVVAVIGAVTAPYLRDLAANNSLREAGMALYTEALFTQSEAIRRNKPLSLIVNNASLAVVDTDPPITTIRTRLLADNMSAGNTTVVFGPNGALRSTADTSAPGASVLLGIQPNGLTCGDEYRCPALQVDSGGGIKLCKNKLSC
jgi:type IV fimbrial biogenesis protein FimT